MWSNYVCGGCAPAAVTVVAGVHLTHARAPYQLTAPDTRTGAFISSLHGPTEIGGPVLSYEVRLVIFVSMET